MNQITIYDLPKDIYLYIAELQEDNDVINMLTINKSFNNPIFFQRIFQKRYSCLIPYKKVRESWREFYLRMIYYLAYLKKFLNISYINVPTFDPIYLCKYSKEYPEESLNHHLANYIGRTGNKQMIDNFMNEMGKDIARHIVKRLYEGIVESGNVDLLKYYDKLNLYPKYQVIYNDTLLLESAVISSADVKNIEMLDYILEKTKQRNYENILFSLISGYAKIGNIETFKKYEIQLKPLINRFAFKEYEEAFFDNAIEGRHLNMIRFLIKERNIDTVIITRELIDLIKFGHTDNDLEIVKYLVSKLSDIYLKETLIRVNDFRKIIDKDILQYLDNLV